MSIFALTQNLPIIASDNHKQQIASATSNPQQEFSILKQYLPMLATDIQMIISQYTPHGFVEMPITITYDSSCISENLPMPNFEAVAMHEKNIIGFAKNKLYHMLIEADTIIIKEIHSIDTFDIYESDIFPPSLEFSPCGKYIILHAQDSKNLEEKFICFELADRQIKYIATQKGYLIFSQHNNYIVIFTDARKTHALITDCHYFDMLKEAPAIVSNPNTIYIHMKQNLKMDCRYFSFGGTVGNFILSPNNKYLLIKYLTHNNIQILHTNSSAGKQTIKSPHEIYPPIFSPTSTLLLIPSKQKQITQIWQAKDNIYQNTQTLNYFGNKIIFSPDEKYLVLIESSNSAADGKLHIFEKKDTYVHMQTILISGLQSAFFFPNYTLIVHTKTAPIKRYQLGFA
jgi:WD40 repeat protein